MKRFCVLCIILFFCIMSLTGLTGCVSSNAQKGAGLGAVTGYIGSSLLGDNDRRTSAIYGAGGAIIGYVIGNEMDKNQVRQPVYNPNSPRTNCRKVITRRTINGKTVETIKETCNGTKTVNTY